MELLLHVHVYSQTLALEDYVAQLDWAYHNLPQKDEAVMYGSPRLTTCSAESSQEHTLREKPSIEKLTVHVTEFLEIL